MAKAQKRTVKVCPNCGSQNLGYPLTKSEWSFMYYFCNDCGWEGHTAIETENPATFRGGVKRTKREVSLVGSTRTPWSLTPVTVALLFTALAVFMALVLLYPENLIVYLLLPLMAVMVLTFYGRLKNTQKRG
jgi:predicted RNA-binding Zn-ribbon protein involved in translation (DUF1610 family)